MRPWDENYVDDGGLRPQDDVSLERFLAQGDRTSLKGVGRRQGDRTSLKGVGTPFFSGREAEVNTFRGAARALAIGESAKDAMGETPAKTWPEHAWPHGRARDQL